ncbi:esterase/lipase family protein [Deinococcus malanensis]|uniref:esterase/lipase family protein n=1 Tax=Deinococcus malanensis TaxID=1706855 RepID=UPI00363F3F54
MIANFKKDGWTDAHLFNWSYDSTRSNSVTADLIRQKVDAILAQTGATRVDIISHSMGGLSSRYFLKNLGETAGSTPGCRWVDPTMGPIPQMPAGTFPATKCVKARPS